MKYKVGKLYKDKLSECYIFITGTSPTINYIVGKRDIRYLYYDLEFPNEECDFFENEMGDDWRKYEW